MAHSAERKALISRLIVESTGFDVRIFWLCKVLKRTTHFCGPQRLIVVEETFDFNGPRVQVTWTTWVEILLKACRMKFVCLMLPTHIHIENIYPFNETFLLKFLPLVWYVILVQPIERYIGTLFPPFSVKLFSCRSQRKTLASVRIMLLLIFAFTDTWMWIATKWTSHWRGLAIIVSFQFNSSQSCIAILTALCNVLNLFRFDLRMCVYYMVFCVFTTWCYVSSLYGTMCVTTWYYVCSLCGAMCAHYMVQCVLTTWCYVCTLDCTMCVHYMVLCVCYTVLCVFTTRCYVGSLHSAIYVYYTALCVFTVWCCVCLLHGATCVYCTAKYQMVSFIKI